MKDEGAQFEVVPEAVLAGRYKVVRTIGSGAMGRVYLVQDIQNDNVERALKILHPDLLRDNLATERFLREAKVMQTVKHPNVVRTLEVAQHRQQLFYTMEFVPGRSLEDVMAAEGFSYDRAIQLILEVASGLEAVHAAHVIHRDLKPSNILILDNGAVKITDFGVAKTFGSKLTGNQDIIGTPVYMAPEVVKGGEELTAAADLYSFGCILYEVLTGGPPFRGYPAEVLAKHVNELPKAPKLDRNGVPGWLNDLVMKLLAKSPADRPRSAREVVNVVQFHRKEAPDMPGEFGAAPHRSGETVRRRGPARYSFAKSFRLAGESVGIVSNGKLAAAIVILVLVGGFLAIGIVLSVVEIVKSS